MPNHTSPTRESHQSSLLLESGLAGRKESDTTMAVIAERAERWLLETPKTSEGDEVYSTSWVLVMTR